MEQSKTPKFKYVILGYKRAGKDQLGEYLQENHGHNLKSSSYAAAEIFLYDKLRTKYKYSSVQECFDDRHSHREEWFDLISEYNREDKTRLAREILKTNDGYIGMRCRKELQACLDANIFTHAFWVSRDGCLESAESCTVAPHMANHFIDNNSDLDSLKNIGAKYVDHVLKNTSLTGFTTNNSLHYKEFLDSAEWSSGDSKPLVEGTYKVIAHDIVSSWFETAYFDGKWWLTNKDGQQFPCIIDKWVEG